MKELDIKLTQLEPSDLSAVREFLNNGFKHLLDEHFEYSKSDMDDWLAARHHQAGQVLFGIKASENGFKDFLIGVCAIQQIDWVSRHGELFFLMVDKDGKRATLNDRPTTKTAFKMLLEVAFKELNLNKVWIEVFSNNAISPVLEEFGFVAEGVRKNRLYKEGKYIDALIFSLLAIEYRGIG